MLWKSYLELPDRGLQPRPGWLKTMMFTLLQFWRLRIKVLAGTVDKEGEGG